MVSFRPLSRRMIVRGSRRVPLLLRWGAYER